MPLLPKGMQWNKCYSRHTTSRATVNTGVSLEEHARCMTLQEVPKIQISGVTEALIQESVKSDSLAETNGADAKFP